MKNYVKRHQLTLEFQVGEKVVLKLTSQTWKKIISKMSYQGMISKYDRPFEVIEPVDGVSYQLNLLERQKIPSTFYMSFLKTFMKMPKTQKGWVHDVLLLLCVSSMKRRLKKYLITKL